MAFFVPSSREHRVRTPGAVTHDYRRIFRFSEPNIQRLADLFLGDRDETRGHVLSRLQKMEIFLRYVGDPGFQTNNPGQPRIIQDFLLASRTSGTRDFASNHGCSLIRSSKASISSSSSGGGEVGEGPEAIACCLGDLVYRSGMVFLV